MPSNWTCAEEYCRSGGAHLASVTSDATNEFILSELSKKGCTTLWIGGTDKGEKGSWRWTDCSPWEFTYWQRDQPSDHEGQDCLRYSSTAVLGTGNLKWNDWTCSDKYHFLCSQKLCAGINKSFILYGVSFQDQGTCLQTLYLQSLLYQNRVLNPSRFQYIQSGADTFFKLKLLFSGQYGGKTQNPTLSNEKWTIWIGIASAALLLCFVALVLFLWRKQKKRIPAQLNEDQCPVYGLYYFGDGAQIDDHTSEVVDTNSCYGDDQNSYA